MTKEKEVELFAKAAEKEVTKRAVSREEFEAFKAAVIADLNELARSPQSLNVNQGE